ncbi:TPA: hypothetical protein ACH3X2_012362 [Trebouxia sp. C0005]
MSPVSLRQHNVADKCHIGLQPEKVLQSWGLRALKERQELAGREGTGERKGFLGPRGDQGFAGLNGLVGPLGPAGPQGPRGLRGDRGLNGNIGFEFKAKNDDNTDMVVRGADVYRRRAAPEGRAPPAPKPAPKPKGPDPKPGQAYGELAPGPFNAGAHGAPPKAQPKKEAPKPRGREKKQKR